MKTCYFYVAVLYGLPRAWAQSTIDTISNESIVSTDALVSTTTSLALDPTIPGDSATATASVTESASTIPTTDDVGGTPSITADVESSTESISESVSAIGTPGTANTTFVVITPSPIGDGNSTATSASPVSGATLPITTDAAKYLSRAFPPGAPQPTWATGQYYTMLATALYSVDRSFVQRTDYQTIVSAIESAANDAEPEVSASVETSAWGWGIVTTNTWYATGVPVLLQTEVVEYNSAWHSAASSVKALATAATSAGTAATAAPRFAHLALALAGVVAGIVGVAIG